MAKKQQAKEAQQKEIGDRDYDYAHSGMVNHVVTEPDITCVSRTVECYTNQGHNNFRILTLYIRNGKVIKMDVSDAYANFECIDKLQHWSELGVIHLNNNWKAGKTVSK